MDEKEIIKLFSDETYIEALKKLEKEYKLKNTDIRVNLYLYFIYEILNKNKNKNEQYAILEKKFFGKKDELFYQLAITCEKISLRHNSYFCFNDIYRFLNLAIKENPNNSDSLFLFGKMQVNYSNVIEGFKLINKAININSKFSNEKLNFLTKIFIQLKSKNDLKYILNELKTYNKKRNGNEYYLKLLEINIALKNYAGAKRNIDSFKPDKTKKFELYQINKLCLDYYILVNNFVNAIKYADKLDLWEKAECYNKFKKHDEAAKSLEEYLKSKSKRTTDCTIMNKIADSYLRCNKLELALEFTEKAISNILDKNFHILEYLNSFIIKGKVFLKQRKFIKSIETFEFAYDTIKSQLDIEDNINKEKILREKLENILFNLAQANAKAHIYKFIKSNKVFTIPKKLKNLKEYNSVISNIELSYYFRTQFKRNFNRFIKELLALNSNREKDVNRLEKEIKNNEEKHKKLCYLLIIKLSKKIIKLFPNNKEVLFNIALNHQNLEEFNKSLLNYNKLIKLNPDNSTYNNNIAVIYQKQNKFKKAEMFFLKSIKLKDYDSTIYDNIFNFYNEYLKQINEKENANKKRIIIKINETFDFLVNKEISQSSKISHRTYNNLVSINNLTIFKYKSFNINILDSLTNNYLYFSSLNELNDPLDIPLLEMSKLDIYKNLEINIDDIKIFCTSFNNNNTLMWSHYTDSHKGICIGYKFTSLPQNIGWNLIEYVNHNLNFERMSKDKGLIHAGIYSKQKHWEHEKEIRFIRYKESDKKVYYKYPIEPNEKNCYIEGFIDQIIVGYKFSNDNFKILIPILNKLNKDRSKTGLDKIKLYTSKIEQNKPFNLKIVSKYY